VNGGTTTVLWVRVLHPASAVTIMSTVAILHNMPASS
jgi:hypothetical protein